jgi:hypothetical protein
MKDGRFDSLGTLAASPTRRGALLLAGIALCGLGGILGRSEAETSSGDGKRDRRRQRRRERERRRKQRKSGRPLYPDLQTLAPQELCFDEVAGVRVLRFTNTVWNAGNGRLELEGATSEDDGDAGELSQNLYDRPTGGKRVGQRRVEGEIIYHPGHGHYHFADFASYQLLKRGNDGDFQPVGVSQKTSFCITDNFRREGNFVAQYTTCNQERQGLTPGWRDTYRWNLVDQWVVLEDWPLPDGEYRLRSVADPDGLLDEGGGGTEGNNTGDTEFRAEDVPSCDELIFP